MLPHCGLDNYNLKEFKSEFMKTLYVSDMDGTLLGTDSRVSCETAEIVSGEYQQYYAAMYGLEQETT